jgi:transposase
MIDGTIVRAHQHAAGAIGGKEHQALGRSCGGFSSKIHIKVDALGLPLKFVVTPEQEHESQSAVALFNDESCEYLLADRAYDIFEFREILLNSEIQPVIPCKKNRILKTEHDAEIYKKRNVVERFINRIKHFRRIATRYDKTAIMYLGSLLLVSILLWLK